MKLGCSLMPKNQKTDKTDCHQLTEEYFRAFHTKQVEKKEVAKLKKGKGKGKGKQRTHNSPDAGKPEASMLVLSPLGPLPSLGALMLESGRSSATNTPSDNPTAISLSPEHSAPSPPIPRIHIPGHSPHNYPTEPPVTIPAQNSTEFVVEVPAVSKYLKAKGQKASLSHTSALPASADGSNAARITVLERKMEEVEKLKTLVHEMDLRLKKVEA